jgi:hypothetical protein
MVGGIFVRHISLNWAQKLMKKKFFFIKKSAKLEKNIKEPRNLGKNLHFKNWRKIGESNKFIMIFLLFFH